MTTIGEMKTWSVIEFQKYLPRGDKVLIEIGLVLMSVTMEFSGVSDVFVHIDDIGIILTKHCQSLIIHQCIPYKIGLSESFGGKFLLNRSSHTVPSRMVLEVLLAGSASFSLPSDILSLRRAIVSYSTLFYLIAVDWNCSWW